MKIAIIDQHGNPGGGLRFVRALAEGLAESYPGDEVAVLAAAPVLAAPAMRELVEHNPNVRGVVLDGAVTAVAEVSGGRVRAAMRRIKALVWLYRRLRGLKNDDVTAGAVDPSFSFSERLVRQLEEYDVVYLAWPFFIEPTALPAPIVATFHDFNYRHDFGNFTPEMVETLERQVPGWLRLGALPVCSTDFIADEMRSFYPEDAPSVDVIPLATFITTRPTPKQAAETVKRIGLPSDFILCPTNIARHKNTETLFEAQRMLVASGVEVPLVLCGWGTDFIAERMRGRIPKSGDQLEMLATRLRESGLRVGRDVYLLGYISDADVDALVTGASLVISASGYEAGSGPALDAWLLGTPVALSGIPAHREQVKRLGTAAVFFDQTNAADVAAAITRVLEGDMHEMVRQSAESLSGYDWTKVAHGYHGVFERAVRQAASRVSVAGNDRGVS